MNSQFNDPHTGDATSSNNMERSSRYEHYMGVTALSLAIAQIVLVLVSWIISSLSPGSIVRSLISSDGVRWFFGRFVDHLSSYLLVWILLIAISWGALRSCGIIDVFKHKRRVQSGGSSGWGATLRQRYAFLVSVVLFILLIIIVVLLSFIQNAVLLSSTGRLFPSPFSHSLVPIVAFIVTVCSLSFGIASTRLNSISGIMRALTSGFQPFLPILIVYVLAIQLFHSMLYVFFG